MDLQPKNLIGSMIYRLEFYSNWHCGSGLSSGTEADLLVIKDENNFPLVPGKTIKGLLKDACLSLQELGAIDAEFTNRIFGNESSRKGSSDEIETTAGTAWFSSARLSEEVQKGLLGKTEYLYTMSSATAIDQDGQAKDHSLRRMETTVPLSLFGEIDGITYDDVMLLDKCMRMVKCLGTGRTRGLGRCEFDMVEATYYEKLDI